LNIYALLLAKIDCKGTKIFQGTQNCCIFALQFNETAAQLRGTWNLKPETCTAKQIVP